MSEWRMRRIKDVVRLLKKKWKVGDECLPYIGLEHIQEGSLRIHEIGASENLKSDKFYFDEKTFLFGKLRPYFRKVYNPSFKGVCSTDIWVLQARGDNYLDFLFYYFANKEFIDLSYSGASGTRMPRADWEFVSNTEWLFPPLPEQRAIAEVLSSLDDKIDLLHRQNRTLEQMAETLFRQWFVEEAQEDWKSIPLYDTIEIVGGGTPKTSKEEYWEGDVKWLSGKDIAANHRSFVVESEKSITLLGLEQSSAKLLPKYSTVISARGTVGKYCLLSEPMAFSQSNYGIKPKLKGCFFFTYLLLDHCVEELRSSAYGSVFDTITTNTFKNITVQMPTTPEIVEFESNVQSFFFKMLNNQNQIQTLTNLRDTLLPKLMSGEVRIRMNG